MGVHFMHVGASQVARLKSRGILVLSGGALNTPRLLLSSGIGPSNAAAGGKGLNIESAQVGRGLSDHTIASKTFRLPRDQAISAFPYNPPSDDAITMYARDRSGPLAQFGPTIAAFFLSHLRDASSQTGFDVEIFVNTAKSADTMKVRFVLMKPTCSSQI